MLPPFFDVFELALVGVEGFAGLLNEVLEGVACGLQADLGEDKVVVEGVLDAFADRAARADDHRAVISSEVVEGALVGGEAGPRGLGGELERAGREVIVIEHFISPKAKGGPSVRGSSRCRSSSRAPSRGRRLR